MISGNIHEKSNLAVLPEPLQRAVQFLKDNDLAAHEPGKFELDGDKMILQVIDQSTGPRENLRPECHRKFIDVQNIFHKMEQRTLVAAYKFYCDKELTDAHSAEADTVATYEVLKAQLDRYPTLENDVDFLAKYSSQNRNVDLAGRIVLNDQDVEVFNFGKYKGQPVETVLKKDPGYFGWILQGDFAQNTKSVLKNIKLRMK